MLSVRPECFTIFGVFNAPPRMHEFPKRLLSHTSSSSPMYRELDGTFALTGNAFSRVTPAILLALIDASCEAQ